MFEEIIKESKQAVLSLIDEANLENFYKSNCFDVSYNQIDKKLSDNIQRFNYEASYYNNEIIIKDKIENSSVGLDPS